MAKEHLELEDILQYLPYHLKWYNTGNDEDYGKILTMTNLSKGCKISLSTTLNTFTIQNFDVIGFGFEPILKPLSELKNDKEFWGEFYIEFGGGSKNITQFKNSWGMEILLDPLSLGYKYYKFVLKRKYDVFNLIEKGLAKNILELETDFLKEVEK